MDDVLTFADELAPEGEDRGTPWKILIADDEPSVHLVTKLALGDFTFEGRRVELLSAYGEEDTRRILGDNPDIALILLDVVMDTMDSGFTLVRHIRDTMRNKDVRIIMRTGQSGNAPEDRIIINYDINDFKDKTELTVAKLRTTMISSLRTYSHLKIIAEEQRKSQTNRAYLHTIIDSLSSVLVTLDFSGQVLLWNREAERWTGIAATEARGHDLFEVAPVFGPLKALFQEILDHPGPESHPRIERTAVPLWKGEQVFVHLILQVLPGSSGPEILFRLDDRTVAKQQDDQVLRSQRVNAFSSLAAGIAGELDQVLKITEGDPAERIRLWGLRASGLLDRLVRFSPLATQARFSQDWASVVAHKIETRTLPSSIAVVYQNPPAYAWVGAHSGGLETMVENLFENAVDAMTSMPGARALQGPWTIEVSLSLIDLKESDRVKHPDLVEGAYWCLSVRDHGVGMSAEVADQVFDPYFTTKPDGQGLGLGLPLVYSLTEVLGGFVDLSSAPGEGTLVRVCLPAHEANTAPLPQSGAILICDDEPLMRQVAGKILRHQGYEVLEAADGPAALELLRAEEGRIKLVILDMVLPGIPGLEVFREIHQRAPGVPVLLSSGFGRGEGVDQALAEGVTGFLQKPYRAVALSEAVRRAIGS